MITAFTLLIASLVGLAAGPVLHRLSQGRDRVRSGLDGLTFVAIAGLVLFHILPECVALAGIGAVAAAMFGLFGPLLFEKFIHRLANQAHRVAIYLALSGLVLHAAVDGAALAAPRSGDGIPLLGLAVALHRIPVALAVWWLFPSGGRRPAAILLIVLGIATIAGFFGGRSTLEALPATVSGLFQSLVAGSLLHVVAHRTPEVDLGKLTWRWASGMGALLGIGVLVAVSGDDAHAGHAHAEGGISIDGWSTILGDMALQSAPALVVAYLMAGAIQVFLPKVGLLWIGKGGRASQALRGVGFGLPLPICSCGVIPIYRGLVKQGVPLAAALAFLVATPELGLDAVLLSMPLLGLPMTLLRIGAAAIVAVVVGIVVSRFAAPHDAESDAPDPIPAPAPANNFGDRVRNVFGVATGELVDTTLPWIILGLAVASLMAPTLSEDWISSVPSGLEVPLFALLGMPLYVCASGATPLVAVLMSKGVSAGAALAFLLTGPATNVTTFGLLSRLHGLRTAVAFAGFLTLFTVLLGYAANLFIDEIDVPAVMHRHDDPSMVQRICLVLMITMLVMSILRQGARGFVGQIFSWTRLDGDDHDHDHDDGHADDAGDDADGCCH